MKHKYNIGQLVELDNGVRLFVVKHFDNHLEYGLGFMEDMEIIMRAAEAVLSPIHNPTYRETS